MKYSGWFSFGHEWNKYPAMERQEKQRSLVSKKVSRLKDDSIYSRDGVDLSLIRWMLSMTPTERLQTLQQNIRSIMRLRGEKSNT